MGKCQKKKKIIAKPPIQTTEALQILLQFIAFGIRNATEYPPAILLQTNLQGSSKAVTARLGP